MDQEEEARQDEVVEAELLAQNIAGMMGKLSSAEGVKVLTARVDFLKRRAKELAILAEEADTDKADEFIRSLRNVRIELEEARQRLAEYEHLNKGRN